MKYRSMLRRQKTILIYLIIILVIGVLGLLYVLLQPTIKLTKKNKMTDIIINVGSNYQEIGVKAYFLWNDISKNIEIENNVDTSKIGDYQVTYKLKHWNRNYKKTRNVYVRDLEPPTITLDGENPITICPTADYQEQGVKAIDNIDGDITKDIKKKIEKSKVVYQVKDKSGNMTTVTRDLLRADKTPPNITLKGGDMVTLIIGNTYSEAGYDVNDNCDSNIDVTISGSVDINKIGTYELSYSATDSSSNNTVVKRFVRVVPKTDNSSKVIYLTFDDGPSASITPGILRILKEENVKATFFVINRDSSLDYLIKQAYNDGHTVAIHSYTHNYRTIYTSEDAFLNDINLMRDKIYNITGNYTNLIRFPGGSSNTVSRFNRGIMTRLAKLVNQRGFIYFDWNVSSGDAGDTTDPNKVYQNVVSNLNSKTNIVLMHDAEGKNYTLNALRNIIRYGKSMGYTFAAISEDTKELHHSINN